MKKPEHRWDDVIFDKLVGIREKSRDFLQDRKRFAHQGEVV